MNDLAYWPAQKPNLNEEIFIRKREYLNNLIHVDQLWDYLKISHGEIIAVNDLRGKNKEKYSYRQLAENITKVSKAFYELGVRYGDVVTLISENSPRWLIVDQAIMRLGAIDAVRGTSSPSHELDYIIDHSKSIGLIVESKDVWLKLNNRDELKKKMKFIISLEDQSFENLISWRELVSIGEKNAMAQYLSEIKKITINDIASILYTSGTTGKPKGVPLTHANFLHQIINLACIADPKPSTSVLSVLPIWHSYERSAEYFFFSCGCSQFYTSKKFLKDDIKIIKPEVMATVPRLWEAIHDGFFMALKKMSKIKRNLIKLLLKNSSIFKKNLRRIKNLEIEKVSLVSKLISLIVIPFTFPLHKLCSAYLWPSILEKLCGTNLRFPINGGGALPVHVDLFFESLGVNVLVGYGLTETSPVLTCRRTELNVRGTSGQPLPFTEIKIVGDDLTEVLKYRQIGKIFAKGPQIMTGYLYDNFSSEKVLSKEGWFDTGDLGFLLPCGSLVITGRAKDTIVLSSGENIEPNPLETEILSSDYVNQVQLVGQDKKNLSALIVPNLEIINSQFLLNDLNQINKTKEIRKFYKNLINKLLQNRLGSRQEEIIINCVFVKPFTLENGLLTQTLKQKRNDIEKIYQKDIEEMYKKQIKKNNII